MITVTNRGIFQNLISQLDRLAKHNRHGSFKTRERYLDAMKRLCVFLADYYRVEKLSNISSKHIKAYVELLQEKERSIAYIKTELSAIRLFHDLIPEPRYKLPSNDDLQLGRRHFGEVDRTWGVDEYEQMIGLAVVQNENTYADMIILIRHTGLRLHECARLDTAAVEGACRSNSLTVKGKGGKVRSIPLDEQAMQVLQRRYKATKRGCKLFVLDGVKTDSVMNDLEQFVIRSRPKDRESGVNLTIHGLRHTWAVEQYRQLISDGATPYEARKQVSQWLGHERDSVTNIYLASLSKDELRGGVSYDAK